MEYKGIKSTWRKIDNVVMADYIGASHKICEVNVNMSYPATKSMGEAHMSLILAAPKMHEALTMIADKLDSEEMNVNSFEYKLWTIANNALK